MADDNEFLGEYLIENLPPKPKGEVMIKVTFQIYENKSFSVYVDGNELDNPIKVTYPIQKWLS